MLGTCAAPLQTLPPQLQAELRALFPLDHFELAPPPRPQREALLRTFFDDARLGVPRPAPPPAAPPAPLRKAPPPPKRGPSAREVSAAREEEAVLRRQLRMELREACMKLGSDRRFREWARPLDPRSEVGAAYCPTRLPHPIAQLPTQLPHPIAPP